MSFATRAPPQRKFGTRAARLNNRNVDPEGCNFLRDGFDKPFNFPLRGLPRESLTLNELSSRTTNGIN
jgi:hypothetical protein